MDLRLLEGDWGRLLRSSSAGIYQARPDVNSVIHTHSHYVSVLSTTYHTIGMYNVVSVLFFD